MYLSLLITQKGYFVKNLTTTATVKLKQSYDDLAIEEINLSVTATVPDISQEELEELAEVSKFKCPVSKALAVVPIILTAVKLED
jgi:osmotically inducible protein OsmC